MDAASPAATPARHSALVRLFHVVAIAEACSWAGLLIGMVLKHVTETTELGVQVFGPVHGGLVIAYVAVVLVASRVLRWSVGVTVAALVASVPPFATIVFDVWARRNDMFIASDDEGMPHASAAG